MTSTNISFIGAGNMAGAIIHGLVQQGFAKSQLCIANRSSGKLAIFKEQCIATTTDNTIAAAQADILVLAVKPNQIQAVCTQLSGYIQQPIIVSVAGGIGVTAIGEWLQYSGPVVRAMPNTGSALGIGATGLFCATELTAEQQAPVDQLFNSIGISAWVDKESLINSISALSGSGAAYYLYMMEVMQQQAIELGLSAKTASDFCTQTVLGAAELAQQNQNDYQKLREQITSPNGSTFAALEALRSTKFAKSVQAAMLAAVQRSEEMAEENTPSS